MPARIAFSTHYPDRMGELAGRPTYFCEKIVKGLGLFTNGDEDFWAFINYMEKMGCFLSFEAHKLLSPKTTTIRKNYDYWKSKEGQLIQPFFWAGKPYRSKHVVFCPPVRLEKVRWVFINPLINGVLIGERGIEILCYSYELDKFSEDEGFEDFAQLKMWFNEYFEGALLEFKAVER